MRFKKYFIVKYHLNNGLNNGLSDLTLKMLRNYDIFLYRQVTLKKSAFYLTLKKHHLFVGWPGPQYPRMGCRDTENWGHLEGAA